jgi:hypothetical protein
MVLVRLHYVVVASNRDPETPVDKPTGGKRPLGMPDWSPKVVQDIRRSILAAYDAPQFSDHSHGFRPNRGRQTARTEIPNLWVGTKWFLEGDLKGCLVTVTPTDSVEDAVRLMRTHAIRRLPVVEGGQAVGIVSLGDLAVKRDPGSALGEISAAPPNA